MGNDELIAAYELHMRRRNLSRKTIYDRLWGARRLADYLDGDLLEASRANIEAWLDTFQMGPRTRLTYIALARAFYAWALREGLIESDPTEFVVRPKTGRLLPHPIAQVDLARALAAADARMYLWLVLGAYMGFRCIEIAQLQAEDIHKFTSTPSIMVRHGKGDKDRMVPLNAVVETALTRYGVPRSGYLFRTHTVRSGSHIRVTTISGMVSAHMKGLGIAATAHDLRHYFASELYRITRDIRIVQEMMGHSSPKTTAIYVAFDAQRAFEVVRGLGNQAPLVA